MSKMSECFICRDVELQASDPLRNFCDCKNLLAHHVCLFTWIQRGCGCEDRLRCSVCKAKTKTMSCRKKAVSNWEDWEWAHPPILRPPSKDSIMLQYQLQRSSPWRLMSAQWQTWIVLIIAFAFLGLVPYAVHCMMTAFNDPPPSSTFKIAAVVFGVLTEILLMKCLFNHLSSHYRLAEQSSFTLWPRGSEARSEPATAGAGHASSVASLSQVDESKVDTLRVDVSAFSEPQTERVYRSEGD